jgi:tRNA A-37 threonylcarbamoyl transferase component Bud32
MVDRKEVMGEALAGRYVLERELGRGGMATVYLARDQKHRREVALKLFRPDLAAALGPDRFLREIQITAGLNHPHILPLLDSGVVDGLLFYVMPYVSGGSLRRLLTGLGEGDSDIPLEAVLRIGQEVASALDYAHSRGVVHRDIKPENILFNEGLAVVGDFGIARAVNAAPREQVTRTGAALGTLGYMSPEQALGTSELDARTDVYSLGCVVYEMLLGRTPASWPGPEDVTLGRFGDLPSDDRRRMDGYPGRIEQVLVKALALRPGDRYGSAGEMARGLASAAERTPSFSDAQVQQLLDRAAQLQAQEPMDEGALTMGSVEQVAAQVGIPPEHVREAAKEMVRSDSSGGLFASRAYGGQALDWGPGTAPQEGLWRRSPAEKWDRVVIDSFIEGEVPEEAYAAMVEEIQGTLGIVGHSSILSGSLTWSPATQTEGSRGIVVSVKHREGQTRIRVEERFDMRGARKFFIPLGGLAGILVASVGDFLMGGLGESPPAILIPCLGLGVVAGVFGTIKFEANTRRPQLAALATRLKGLAQQAAERRLGPGDPGPRSRPA